jgi:hypothetical protein
MNLTASLIRCFAAMLILMALSVRIAVPAGWMPSGEKAFALTVCTGMDVSTIWLDSKGKLHKEDPSKGKAVDHAPCAFAAAHALADIPAGVADAVATPHLPKVLPTGGGHVSIGHGLAAPPPPAIGPPVLI